MFASKDAAKDFLGFLFIKIVQKGVFLVEYILAKKPWTRKILKVPFTKLKSNKQFTKFI